MTTLVVLSVVDIVLLIAGLAFYLFVVGGQLARVATNLEECAELVRTVQTNAEVIQRAGQICREAHPINDPAPFVLDLQLQVNCVFGSCATSIPSPPYIVPEPETYLLMLAGLGFCVFVQRRGKLR